MPALVGAQPLQVAGGDDALRLRVGFGADHEHADVGYRPGEALGRLELLEIGAHHLVAADGVDEMREGEGDAEVRRVGAAVVARPQHPDRRRSFRLGERADAGEGVVDRQRVVQESVEVLHHVGKVVRADRRAVGERARRGEVAAGRAADAEIDSPRVEGLEDSEGLGDLVGAVMRQHDAPGADADMPRLGGDAGDHDLGRRPREPLAAVMLGQPITAISQAFHEFGKLDRFRQRVARRAAGTDRRLIEHSQPERFPVRHW